MVCVQIADASIDAAHYQVLVVVCYEIGAFGVDCYFQEHVGEILGSDFDLVFAGGDDAFCFDVAEGQSVYF